jgi:hypothetical protein
MFSHIMVGSNDVARSKKFYDALFVAMGAQPGVEVASGRLLYPLNGGRFLVTKPILTFAIPMATNCAPFIASQLPE